VFNHDVDAALMMEAGLAINAAAFLPGDYNHDDRVDAADYVVWRDALGSMTELAADGSGNSVVDDADYDVWRANFGYSFGEPVATAAASLPGVPEPSTIAILAGVILSAATRSHKRGTAARFG
jgi:hypothetical protein